MRCVHAISRHFPIFPVVIIEKKSTELIRATIQLLLLIKSSCYNVRRITIRRSTYYRGVLLNIQIHKHNILKVKKKLISVFLDFMVVLFYICCFLLQFLKALSESILFIKYLLWINKSKTLICLWYKSTCYTLNSL
jgi:hypothetical protein